uniref:F-box associated domain-containing protein n=1 Tax=Setaria italica TaxID=4555 RepID=A0A0Q3R238_SETIT
SPFPDVVVCEPLTRRCRGILSPEEHATCLGVFLLDSGGRIGMSDFRVVAVLHEYHESEEGRAMPAACVFSLGSDGGGWRVLPTASTNSAAVSLPGEIERVSFADHANGSLYWVVGGEEDGAAMLVFDEAAMEFARVPLPADDDDDGGSLSSYDRWSFRVIGGGEDGGALRVVRLVRNELRVLARRRGSDGNEWVWVVERLVRLREATLGLPGRDERFFQRNAMVVAAHEGYVLVTPQEKTWLFSVELETMRVERESTRGTSTPGRRSRLSCLGRRA